LRSERPIHLSRTAKNRPYYTRLSP